MSELPLNSGQQAATEGVFNWLFNNEQRELCISGPGGVGKTFLMGRIIDKVLPRYFEMCNIMGIDPIYREVHMTATTNKAAEVLGIAANRPTQTIQSLFRLRVFTDYDTGSTKLVKSKNWGPHFRKIIFVDESSMVDSQLRRYLLEGAQQCKIIYVGDHCQLAPVGERISPIYADNLPFFELTEPMRNAGQPALKAVCLQLRRTVETGKFQPIQVVPGVIDYLSPDSMQQEVRRLFMARDNKDRILCYTNDKVNRINNFIREMRKLPNSLTIGEFVINNSAITDPPMRVEDEYEIVAMEEIARVSPAPGVELEVRYCTLKGKHATHYGVPVPIDYGHFNELLKYFKKKENWLVYYRLKETYPDLRPKDASTVYKAQGSTYDTSLIDLDDLSTCFDTNTAARMLYVAFSRAKSRVVMYGKLADKYGGLIR